MLRQHLGENAHAAVDRAGEVLLLHADDAGDIGGAPAIAVGIVALVLVDNVSTTSTQERMVHAEQLAVAGSAAEQAAQHYSRGPHSRAARRRRS